MNEFDWTEEITRITKKVLNTDFDGFVTWLFCENEELFDNLYSQYMKSDKISLYEYSTQQRKCPNCGWQPFDIYDNMKLLQCRKCLHIFNKEQALNKKEK